MSNEQHKNHKIIDLAVIQKKVLPRFDDLA